MLSFRGGDNKVGVLEIWLNDCVKMGMEPQKDR